MRSPTASRSRNSVLLVLTIAALIVRDARAEGGYHPPDEMIDRSEFIAVVTVSHVEPLEKTESPRWSFGQRAHAVVQQNIKGTLPRQVELYGDENHVCQQTELRPGTFVAFLVRDEQGRLHASNYQISMRPIRDAAVEWYSRGGIMVTENYRFMLRWQPLEDLISRITARERQPKA